VRFGPFQLVELLAKGGTAEVWRAFRLGEGGFRREVALKMLLRGHDEALFLKEARLAATLAHPNIASVLSVGRERGRLYLEEELVRGRDLGELLTMRRLPLAASLAITAGVLEALEHAHATGIIHRDLKPANVMITTDGRVKLVDFGLARADDGTATALRGTPGWMAPELLLRAPPTPRSDLYAVGLILRAMAPHAPAGVLNGLLAAHPTERFASAADALAAVRTHELAAPQALAEIVPTEIDRPRRPRRRRRRLHIARWVAAGLLAGAILGALLRLAYT
jgi:serine/threonine protein kinase